MKTCDAGQHEAKQAFKAGADIITVMAFSHNKTIQETLEAARNFGKRIMIDLLGVDSTERTEQLRELGVDLFCLHIGKDMQQGGALADSSLFRLVEGLENVEVAIAGGLSDKSIGTLKNSIVDIAIVGSAITGSSRPDEASRIIRELS